MLAPLDARTSTMEDIAMTTRREFFQIGAGALAGLAFVGWVGPR